MPCRHPDIQKFDGLRCCISCVETVIESLADLLLGGHVTSRTSLRRQLYCREGSIPITSNCEAALRCLKRRGRRRVLWIDAVCIDQGNVDEKNYQVQLMATTYSEASQVLVYLGLRDQHEQAAIGRVADYLEGKAHNEIWPDSEGHKRDFQAFLGKAYWDRVWVSVYHTLQTRRMR
ncbi:HET-domain-containing protein [Setomelanomma holmii]|uniref:HET-domain-containing protein n=1 Tax=Setomelanomma holmii TaxID=210430 RepID=A0A9P4H113_9PLEO|nr:HET-domain-containing protein [Setomelanomma holmii]